MAYLLALVRCGVNYGIALVVGRAAVPGGNEKYCAGARGNSSTKFR